MVVTVRRFILLCAFVGAIIFGWFKWRERSTPRQPEDASGVTINKRPVNFSNRTFDPSGIPADMPPMAPGEDAECDSNFQSNASVGGETRQADATHATVTVTQVKMTLQLNVTIWVPADVTQHVVEHEEGHRQISEYYYRAADTLARRIAARFIGKQVDVTGTNLDAESNKVLQQMATEITGEYNTELSPGPAQSLYDTITDHSRNGVVATDAVAHALKNVVIESNQPATNPGN